MSSICIIINYGDDYMAEALVFSIEEFSTFDGPGIRTTVFLKGCPLRCEWCHNPEGQRYENEVIRSQFGCIVCGECLKHAENIDSKIKFTEKSVTSCPNHLLRPAGKLYTSQKIVDILLKNINILNNSGGGITFSGGEPLSHPEFLIESLKLLENKTHRAVQTSGFCNNNVFKEVLQNIDYMLFDIKLVDELQHIKYTGVSNKLILKNLETLVKSGKDFVIRTPLIPTVTDTVQNITKIALLLDDLGIREIDLLPYNMAAGGKYESVGRKYEPSFDEKITCEPRVDIFKKYKINANIL